MPPIGPDDLKDWTDSGTQANKAPGRSNGGPWSLEHDQELWSVLGGEPRTASGSLSVAGGVGALVQQLAQRFGRTEMAIKERIAKELDDPNTKAYARLHGLPPPAKMDPWTLADDQVIWNSLGHLPRGKMGGLSRAASGDLVSQLAGRFGRDDKGIIARLKQLEDPKSWAHGRLHAEGVPPPAKRPALSHLSAEPASSSQLPPPQRHDAPNDAPPLPPSAVAADGPRSWSMADDQVVWDILGYLQGIKGGLMAFHKAGCEGLVHELAERFARSDKAIIERIKHLWDPTHAAHARLHSEDQTLEPLPEQTLRDPASWRTPEQQQQWQLAQDVSRASVSVMNSTEGMLPTPSCLYSARASSPPKPSR
ncbi:hypothetical protein T484DRAFT_1852232 [Baffinella frigidus]|nr:hypothetical protein T484DRAFT_1852232 [Cryptophyta sp. CCMP2293]